MKQYIELVSRCLIDLQMYGLKIHPLNRDTSARKKNTKHVINSIAHTESNTLFQNSVFVDFRLCIIDGED